MNDQYTVASYRPYIVSLATYCSYCNILYQEAISSCTQHFSVQQNSVIDSSSSNAKYLTKMGCFQSHVLYYFFILRTNQTHKYNET